MNALVTGATGFIGRHLLARLDRPVVLTRDPGRAAGLAGERAHAWDPEGGAPPPAEAFEGVDAVFHLAGESVAKGRWTTRKRERILRSREEGTRALVAGMRGLARRPRVLVCASAIGFYGDRGDETLAEEAAGGDDFLARVCATWEREAVAARDLGVRVVTPRIGIVLGREGGALPAMLPPFRLGIGGRLGSGRQWMSWIHVQDLVGLLLHAAEREQVSGPMNAAAPNAATNREFTRALARALRRPAIFPVPRVALRLALGGFADALLSSQRVVPDVAQRTGYRFRFPDLDGALRNLLSP